MDQVLAPGYLVLALLVLLVVKLALMLRGGASSEISFRGLGVEFTIRSSKNTPRRRIDEHVEKVDD